MRYLLNGGDIVTLQMILGHESLEMTRHYLSLTEDQALTQHRAFSPIDRLGGTEQRRFAKTRK